MLKGLQNIHFIGIGGAGMSAIAHVLLKRGYQVSGSDLNAGHMGAKLAQEGALVYMGHAECQVDDVDAVVISSAIHQNNPELMEAKKRNLPILHRSDVLAEILNHADGVAVAGAHGKTTTTSMLSQIFLAAKKDPTISVGGILDAIGGNIRIGHSENFITEACEYTNSFLKFHPTAGIILNVDADHLDFFKDIDDIRHSFRKYAELIPENGVLVINKDIDKLNEITDGLKCKVITFGLDDGADYSAADISFDEKGHGCYTLIRNGQKTDMQIKLNVVGRHNISNSLSAIALSEYYGIDEASILNGLSDFVGTERRFELKGTFNGVTVIDDYAHHPTEIAATLAAAQKYPHKHLWCVFQPHTYSRTRALLKEFAQALSLAENIVLADIYAAREQDPGDISSKTLQAELEKLGKKAYYFPSFDEIEKFLLENCINGDLLITMGAGNVVSIGEALVNK